MSDDDARTRARQLEQAAHGRGTPLAWFEELYASAHGPEDVSWADLEPNPSLTEWLERERIAGDGRRALVVGCGLGDDAEALAGLGFQVAAFDISPTAIAWARRRFPSSSVEYEVANALEPPGEWRGTFDFVLESYTFQVLPPKAWPALAGAIEAAVAPGGVVLLIARGRDDNAPLAEIPYALSREELSRLFAVGLAEERIEDFLDREDPPVRRLRALYRRL
jgi:SAM-dependent methyltransferase